MPLTAKAPGRSLSPCAFAAGLVLLVTQAAWAHYRPLVTEDLSILPSRTWQLEVGAEFQKGAEFPFSGLEGDLWKVGTMSLERGLGTDGTAFVRGPAAQRLSVKRRYAAPNSAALDFKGPVTYAQGNYTLGTRIRFTRPRADGAGFGFQFAVELPDTPNQTGLGNDEMNFFGTFIYQVALGETDLFANLGCGVLTSPSRSSSQQDKPIMGLGFAHPLDDDWKLLGELEGLGGAATPGTEDHLVARLAVQWEGGRWAWDAGALVGFEPTDPSWGLTFGLTRRWGP